MIVVGHEAVGVNANGKPRAGCLQIFEEFFTVAKAFKDVFAGIAPIDDVVKGAWKFHAQRPGHGLKPLKDIRSGQPICPDRISVIEM
jgi:hypothetical protein